MKSQKYKTLLIRLISKFQEQSQTLTKSLKIKAAKRFFRHIERLNLIGYFGEGVLRQKKEGNNTVFFQFILASTLYDINVCVNAMLYTERDISCIEIVAEF